MEPEGGAGGVAAFEPLAPDLEGNGRIAELDDIGAGAVGEHPRAIERSSTRSGPAIEQARVVEALEAALGIETARARGLALEPAGEGVRIERCACLLERRHAHGVGRATGGEGFEQFARALALAFSSQRLDRGPRFVGLLA